MHRTHSEAALQRRIGVSVPKRHPVGHVRTAVRLDPLDAGAQSRKRAHA
jgi:hypothetical protein